jgi:hypothetical protein
MSEYARAASRPLHDHAADRGMNQVQEEALRSLCERYKVPFNREDYRPTFDLPSDWVAGWVGGQGHRKLYVGCSPEGRISS